MDACLRAFLSQGQTLSMVDAGIPEVDSTRTKALTDVSPVEVGSTDANALLYIPGTVAPAARNASTCEARRKGRTTDGY